MIFNLAGRGSGGLNPPGAVESFLSSEYFNPFVSTTNFVPGGILEAFPPYELSGAKCYYNNVLLPGIPDEILARYPYAWIRNNTTTGYYDLFLSDVAFYYSDGIEEGNGVAGKPRYRVEIATAETETGWTNNNNTQYSSWGLDSARTVLWSNHDIPNGSATATELYFKGSEPVPAE